MKTINDINIIELLHNSFEDLSLVEIFQITNNGFMNISKLEDGTEYITYIEDYKETDECIELNSIDIKYIETLLK